MSRLGPGDMPHSEPVRVIRGDDDGLTDEAGAPAPPLQVMQIMDEIAAKLDELRKPFPPEMIEKLPKPMWKGAWDDQPKGKCAECGGYHAYANTIHLDYVGHANTTNRLLSVDPLWDWEPLAYTDAGLPLFDKVGGLWIKLTVCGVTRLGYGDGSSPKEIIGDAIRNAAMRFGVALDLWSKIDLHAERNPGDGEAPAQRMDTGSTKQGGSSRHGSSISDSGEGDGPSRAVDPPRAPNQDALDSLGSVCDQEGFDRRAMRTLYADWAKSKRYKDRELLTAHSDRIIAFAAHLLEGVDASGDDADEAQTQPPVDSGPADEPAGDVGEVASADAEAGVRGGIDPEDTSDVEKQPGEIF